MSQQQKHIKEQLSQLISFIQYLQIPSSSIWEHHHSLTLKQFCQKMFKNYGYKISDDQMLTLQQLSRKNPPIITKQMFFQFNLWIHERESIRRKSDKKAFSVKKQSNQSLLQNISQATSKVERKKAQITQKNRKYRQNEILKEKIIENALDKKWDYLVKISEMNSWMKSSQFDQSQNTFRNSCKKDQNLEDSKASDVKQNLKKTVESQFYKIKDHGEEIEIYGENEETIPLKVFDLKYQTQKKKHIEVERKKNNMKGTLMMMTDPKAGFNKNKIYDKISQRDQQLNYLLSEIMKTKHTLEMQNEILESCEINI